MQLHMKLMVMTTLVNKWLSIHILGMISCE
jgi:hypothetical protein